ncbi:Anti-sigma regulatory factor (Ser/Thr protein kinase) [Streptomyces sp. yr375]|uniref:ATP-binding protein n=1 Tax=Streptomyces sp. yr375 TaxID=1761906 RepID=UPI0008CBB2EF|nr:ATP-binding protein [Streptomyces sp. yr375]SER00848.1 Anti-sigma regulatory factor (Ser/Thr protein kinase) [Streptomyces sp. yr375]
MQLEIRPDPAEVGRARRWARSRLAGSGIGDEEPLAETLILLVSELVTNAVVHTGCPAVLRLSLPGGGAVVDGSGEPSIVRLEVADTSGRAPVPRCAGDEATGGRGLALVDGLADRWGWSVEGAGKRIWCELDRCAGPGPGKAEPGKTVADAAAAAAAVNAALGRAVAGRGQACEGLEGFEGFAFEVV